MSDDTNIPLLLLFERNLYHLLAACSNLQHIPNITVIHVLKYTIFSLNSFFNMSHIHIIIFFTKTLAFSILIRIIDYVIEFASFVLLFDNFSISMS